MIIEFLVSTIDRTDLSFLDSIFRNVDLNECKVLVINQCISIPVVILKHKHTNVRCISIEEKGLSKSRNLAIKNAQGEICVIADDDIVYLPGCINSIKTAFSQYESDLITYKIITPENKDYKKYKKRPHRVKYPLQIMNISSIAIAFKKESIRNNKSYFNENLGLGAKYPAAEEVLFVHDNVKKGSITYFVPIPIVIHPEESSRNNFTYNMVISNGILFARLFPALFLFADLYFTIKRYPRYRGYMNMLKHFAALLEGNFIEIRRKI